MNLTSACPAHASLEEYLLGRVSDTAAASLEVHLATCPHCWQLLSAIQAEDDFVADFRAQATSPQPRNALLDRLAGDLRRLFAGEVAKGGGPTLPTDAEATPDHADPMAAVGEDVRCLLAPPRAADELGWLGDFRVLQVLGAGGMGVVFLAEDLRLALK